MTAGTKSRSRLLAGAGLVAVLLLGFVTFHAVERSTLLHKSEQTRDGVRFIRLQAAQVWGDVPLPASQPDATADALQRGILLASWKGARHPFGGAVTVGRHRASDPIPGKASVSVTLADVPSQACAILLPRFQQEQEQERVLAQEIILSDGAPAASLSRTCPSSGSATLRLFLATRAP